MPAPCLSNASPTEHALAQLSRVRPEPVLDPQVLASIDVERFLWLAARIGNFSLVVRRLLARMPDIAPPLRARMERNLTHSDLRERLGLADVAELAQGLAPSGISLLLLKGGAYTRFVYPTTGLRTFVDLDVLVPERALAQTCERLGGMGYERVGAVEGAVEMRRRLGRTSLNLEIHTRLIHHHEYPFYRDGLHLDEPGLLARSEPRTLHGAPIRVLGAADELVYSVAHFFFHHDMIGLKYHSDINALLTDPDRALDPEVATAAARTARAQHAVGLTLLVHESLFGPGAVAPALLRALAPGALRLACWRTILPALERLPFEEARVARHPTRILAADGFGEVVRLAWHWLFPGRRFLQAFYALKDDSWRPSYHLRYSSRIVKKGLRRIATIAKEA